jgi:hypothetical protein
MEKHFEFTDEDFEQQFSNATLNPTVFTHEAHLRLAWIHIRKYGIFSAIENICNQLQNYVASLGASDKYNKTVTMAAVKAVYHFMLKSKADDFQVFISENQRLKTNFKELLNTHYSTDIFKSAKAKKEFLEPELLPFDEQW